MDRSELMELISAFMTDPEKPTELEIPGDPRVRLSRSSDVRVNVERTDADRPSNATLFDPTDERPDGFPSDLPFLPDQRSLVFLRGDVRFVMWAAAAAEQLEDVLQQSIGTGWEPGRDWTEGSPASSGMTLRRGRDERTLLAIGVGIQALDRLGELSGG